MATSDIPYLTIDMFLDVVVKKKFPLLSLGWYLLHVVSGNRYLARGISRNALFGTSPGNISDLVKFTEFSEIHLEKSCTVCVIIFRLRISM